MAENDIQSIKKSLQAAKDILILIGQNPTEDAIASGMGLYHTLNTKNQNVFIATPAPINTDQIPLSDINQITHKIGNRNLVISLKVESRENIDKVSYNLDEDNKVFNLVIQPRKGNPPLKTTDIDYSYSGVQADVLITIGANRFEDFGAFYDTEKSLFTDATTINITRQGAAQFTNYQFTAQASSLSEITAKFISQITDKLDATTATDLLFGIHQATQNLQGQGVNAETFETVARLMRAGGKRVAPTQAEPLPVQQDQPETPQPTNVPDDWLSPKIYSGSQSSPTRKG